MFKRLLVLIIFFSNMIYGSEADNILIFARYGFNRDFARILGLQPENIQVIARESSVSNEDLVQNRPFYNAIHLIKDYDNSADVTLKLEEIFNSGFAFKRITYTSEIDVVRARMAAHRYGLIGGMPKEDILVYRDKHIMKTYTRKHGFLTPDFKSISCIDDILDFIKEHNIKQENGDFNPPIVLKDDFGVGSEKIFIFNKYSQLIDYLRDYSKTFGTQPTSRLIVEKYIEGRIYHIDALIGETGNVLFVWPSLYMSPPLVVVSEGKSRGDYVMHQDNPLTLRLNNYAKSLMGVLPKLPGGAIHLEVFVTPSNQIVLCEIAARVGGGRLSDNWFYAFGLSIDEQILKIQAGIPLDIDFTNKVPSILAGGILFPTKGKYLIDGKEPSHQSLADFKQYQKVGSSSKKPESLGDLFATAVVLGETEEEIEQNITNIIHQVQTQYHFSDSL